MGRFSHQKIACLPSWDVSAIKQRHVCFPGAFQPSKSSVAGPWAVAAIKKQHFWLLGSFSYQKTACLAPGPMHGGYHVAAVFTHAVKTRQSCKKSNSVATLQHRTSDLCISAMGELCMCLKRLDSMETGTRRRTHRSAIKKHHFWPLGRVNHQKTLFLAPGVFQP